MKRLIKAFRVAAAGLMLAAALSACAGSYNEQTVFAMDTVITLRCYGASARRAVTQAEKLIKSYDALFSPEIETSDIWKINAGSGDWVEVSEETAELIAFSKQVSAATDGAFDITVYPLSREWGFGSESPAVPDPLIIEQLLANVSSERIEISGRSVRIEPRAGLELGAVAKGYAGLKIAELWASLGVESGCVSLGGNVQLIGSKPDGSAWRVAIQDPFSEEGYVGVLEASDTAVVTSGGYRRYFIEDGVRYHHILDPTTGYPAEAGLASVSVVCADGALADALSTALFVIGEQRALDYWRSAESFELVLVRADGSLAVTQGLAESFSPTVGEAQVIYR